MRTGMKVGVLSRRGLLSVLVVLLMTASAAGAESDSIESTRSTPSPYTYLDAVGDGSPDITAFQVRNGPHHRVELQFRILDLDFLFPGMGASFLLDLVGTGSASEYFVRVDLPLPGRVSVYRSAGRHLMCVSTNVSELRTNRWGRGFSARFRFRCIGGRRTFRTAMAFYYPAGVYDNAPDSGYTPYIRPPG